MRYPNLRYGNPAELAAEIRGQSIPDVAKRLRRSERCIKNWLTGSDKMPFWVPELLRLQRLEHHLFMRQMNIRQPFGLVDTVGKIVPIKRIDTAKIAVFNQGENNENIDGYLLRDRA